MLPVCAQIYTINGYIADINNKKMPHVPIALKGLSQSGTITDENGMYTLKLPEGNHTLIVSYIGFQKKEIDLLLYKDIVLNIQLEQSLIGLDEVVVLSNRSEANISAPISGMDRISVREMEKLPVFFGEKDIVKAFQLMPGVKAASEGNAGFFVRGGTSDQNLISLDNVPVYNASHLMGFFSTFNPGSVQNATLYKGTMPSQYGERLSSVLDVQMKEGDYNQYHLNGGIGLIATNLNMEGPIQKNKSSFIISARRTYADAIAKLSQKEEAKNTTLYFYDLNAKLNFRISDKNNLSFSAYFGKDKLAMKDIINTSWGNLLGTLKWTHYINSKWTSVSDIQYNRYDYKVKLDMGANLAIASVINDYSFNQEFSFYPSPENVWKIGYKTTWHVIAPGDYKYDDDKGERINLQKRYSWENGLYISNSFKFSEKLEVVYGIRLSIFSSLGKGDFYTLNNNHEVTDTTWYGAGKFVKTYIHPEPRVSAVYKLNKTSSFKIGYARTIQNMHLLTNTNINTPMDRWVSSSNNIKPQVADQFSLGYFRNFDNNIFEFSVEGYYKDMRNQVDFKDNAEFDRNDDVETELRFGKGRAYGIEFLLRKRYGKLTGWIGYTLSRSEKRIDDINKNKWYPARQDRTHDISIVGIYEINNKWTLSGAWIYYTGNAVTYPSGKYYLDGRQVVYYSERNGYRAPAYHRLDLSATCLLKKSNKFSSELAFGLYNAYGRENAYIIDFRTNDDDPTKSAAYQYSLFRFIPSISWNFKF